MPDFFNLLTQRARSCPVACFMKVIFLLLFIIAVAITAVPLTPSPSGRGLGRGDNLFVLL